MACYSNSVDKKPSYRLDMPRDPGKVGSLILSFHLMKERGYLKKWGLDKLRTL